MDERPQAWPKLLQAVVVLAMPLALLAASLRLTTGHWLVDWEYGRPGFPPDPYGLATEERIRLAEVCVDYLVTAAGIELLAELELAGGQPAFNARELQHMIDVKRVLWGLLGAGLAAAVLVSGGTALLARHPATRARAPAALWRGSLLSIGLLVAVGGFMLLQWDAFFVRFHELFFPPGTWTFFYSDTLIRLYPVRFWMDVGIVIVGGITVLAVLVGLGALLWRRIIKNKNL
ncbi:MAG: TIGR01906 family membrane protein [Anaerolineae bacterium]|nr:TIGR01906 family membrane protein [Anaerolineae bacterium]